MMTKIIGHLLFPRSPKWEKRRRANVVIVVMIITIGFAAILGGMMYWINSSQH